MKKAKPRDLLLLHSILLMYSLGGIFSKLASKKEFMSFGFLLFYGVVLANLFLYAIFWQQVLKKMPLTTAFANKSVVVIWGMIWGTLVFNEEITLFMLIGAAMISIGVFLVVTNNEQ